MLIAECPLSFNPPSSISAARVAAIALALGWAAFLHALPEDREQPIEIRADEARSEPDGTSVLQGDVKIEQGSLRLTADRVTIATRDKRMHRIVAEGTAQAPVRFRQRIHPDEPAANGHARHVDYAVAQEQLALKGDAFLAVGDREFQGGLILWDIADGRVDARSDDPQGITVKWLPEPTD